MSTYPLAVKRAQALERDWQAASARNFPDGWWDHRYEMVGAMPPGECAEAGAAKDIPEVAFLEVVDALQAGGHWAMIHDVGIALSAPHKVAAAKFTRVLNRGLVTGCDCGCRGDIELTPEGKARLASASSALSL